MLMISHGNQHHQVELVMFNADRIGVHPCALLRFMTSSAFFIFVTVYCAVISLIGPDVFGIPVSWPIRFAFWMINTTMWGIIWFGQFWLIHLVARALDRQLLVLSMVLHGLPLLISAFVGPVVLSALAGVPPTDLPGVSLVLKLLLIALTFEFIVASALWPMGKPADCDGDGAAGSRMSMEMDQVMARLQSALFRRQRMWRNGDPQAHEAAAGTPDKIALGKQPGA